jgi:uncharacterized repeat protein (TIGR01451 family)
MRLSGMREIAWKALSICIVWMLWIGLSVTPGGGVKADRLALRATVVFINEIHYDNLGTDANEGVEVAGPAGTDLSNWRLIPYNGANGNSYSPTTLSGMIPNLQNGYGTIFFYITGLQNGPPDGIALVDPSNVVLQFLSYEGTFMAADGPAVGMMSTDIMVKEDPVPPTGQSLQLIGTGSTYEDFTWSGPIDSTYNAVNTGQTFGLPPGLEIGKDAPGWVKPGEVFTYTITVKNGFNYPITQVNITDAVPGDTTFAYALDGGVESSGVVSWTVASLASKGSMQVRFAVTADNVADTTVYNDDYAVSAAEHVTPTAGAAVATLVNEDLRIRHIQGAGTTSPFEGTTVEELYGVVTLVQDNGFFMQDPHPDANPLTSEGIFVYTGSAVSVSVGQGVTVTGVVEEYNLLTEITQVTSLLSGSTSDVIAPTVVDLPVATDLEPFEGMLVAFPEALTASQNYFQGRYGQVTLSAEGRLYNPLSDSSLGNPIDNLRRMVVLDDHSSVEDPNPIPYIGAEDTLRAGDSVAGLIGVIDYGQINSDGGSFYRLQPTGSVTFNRVNQRTSAPLKLSGDLRITTFNLLNYFNGDGAGGGFPSSRGASSPEEFTRQRTKIITAMLSLDADVLGLMEMENDGAGAQSAIRDLVNGLNAVAGGGTYALITEPAPGTDEIKVSIIYKSGRVTPASAAQNYQTNILGYTNVFDRPPLAQTFSLKGDKFTLIVNHFKSKRCDDATGADLDQGDGKGCYNAKRVAQATALLNFIHQLQTSSGDPDVLVIGDMNSYALEDPITTFKNGGMVDLIAASVPAQTRYTYVFDGEAGYLDAMLATTSLASKLVGVNIWHINADEPSVIDYQTEYKSQDFYTPTAYRSSDHDPVLGEFKMLFYSWLSLILKNPFPLNLIP